MSTVLIPLHSTKHPGLFAIVDEADAEDILKFRWSVVADRRTFYAVRTVQTHPRPNRKSTTIRMHRQIIGAKTGEEVDHVDGNGLNNSRSNLRPCSKLENVSYRQRGRKNTSGYVGVSYAANPRLRRHWKAQITVDGKATHLGYFDTAIEAAIAYDDAARSQRGAFARLNFPRDGESPVNLHHAHHPRAR